jgi:fibronectin type 3 domain-containing protein
MVKAILFAFCVVALFAQLDDSKQRPSVKSVYLTWRPSTTPDVWYNVYRATSFNGPFKKLFTTPIPRFVDYRPPPGYYYYKVTAINSEGRESFSSNYSAAAVLESDNEK